MFLGKDLTKGKWLEWQIQAYIVQEARRAGYFIEGDQNASKRGYGAANRAKACGMTAGTPDLRIYIYPARLVLIELKLSKGIVSKNQKNWHAEAFKLGHTVHIVKAGNPKDAWEQVKEILEKYA